jgi:hypothetical protein
MNGLLHPMLARRFRLFLPTILNFHSPKPKCGCWGLVPVTQNVTDDDLNLIDSWSKRIAVAVGLLYLIGFVVVTGHLSRYGVSGFSVLQLQYLVAGIWVAGMELAQVRSRLSVDQYSLCRIFRFVKLDSQCARQHDMGSRRRAVLIFRGNREFCAAILDFLAVVLTDRNCLV